MQNWDHYDNSNGNYLVHLFRILISGNYIFQWIGTSYHGAPLERKVQWLVLLWPRVTERMASWGAHVLLAITVLGCLYLPRVEPRAHWGATDLHRCGRSGDPAGRVSQVHQSSTNYQGGTTADLINCEGMYTWGVAEETVVKLERLQFLRKGDNGDKCEWRPSCLIPWPKWSQSVDNYLTS